MLMFQVLVTVSLLGSIALTAFIIAGMLFFNRWRRKRRLKNATENGNLISRNTIPLASYRMVENVNYFRRAALEGSNNPTIGIHFSVIFNEPRREEICLRSFRPGQTQTGL